MKQGGRLDRRVQVLLPLAVLVAAVGACGDSDGGGDDGASGDLGMELEPESGPPGTEVTWTIEDNELCREDDDKSATLYAGSLEEYREGGDLPEVETGPISRDPNEGTITIPETEPGPYVVAISCSTREPTGEPGEVTINIVSGETAFEVENNGDEEGEGDDGGDGVLAYCDFSAELDEQEGLPSDAQLDRIQELAPDEISDDVDFVADAIQERGEEAFEDPEVGATFERIAEFEEENCN